MIEIDIKILNKGCEIKLVLHRTGHRPLYDWSNCSVVSTQLAIQRPN